MRRSVVTVCVPILASTLLLSGLSASPRSVTSVAKAAESSSCPADGLPIDRIVRVVAYPTGWNLVSGPEGACVVGAADPAYFLPDAHADGGTGYIAKGAAAPFSLGEARWVYFPNGGVLQMVTPNDVGPQIGYL